MSNFPDWIEIAKTAPTDADLPVLLWNAKVPKAKYSASPEALRSQLALVCFTHWMPAPPPPVNATMSEALQEILLKLSSVEIAATLSGHEAREEINDAIDCVKAALVWYRRS